MLCYDWYIAKTNVKTIVKTIVKIRYSQDECHLGAVNYSNVPKWHSSCEYLVLTSVLAIYQS